MNKYIAIIMILMAFPVPVLAQPFSIIEERTDYGVSYNDVYVSFADSIGKDQYITNITFEFIDTDNTRAIEIADISLGQTYNIDTYGMTNISQGKYKTYAYECETLPANETHASSEICSDNYYSDKGELLDCDFVLADKTCLSEEYGAVGITQVYGYLPLPSTKEKLITDELKIEQKVEGSIPLAKNGTARIRITMPHVSFFGLDSVGYDENKYIIRACSQYGCSELDPFWYEAVYSYYSNYTVNDFVASVSGAILRVNASVLTSPCGTEDIVDSTGANISFYRNGCNLTPTQNITYFLKMPADATENVTVLHGNLTPVSDRTKCDVTVSTACDNEGYAGWSNRNGGGTPTMNQQTSTVLEGAYGFFAKQGTSWHQWFKAINLSASTVQPTRVLWNIWGYNSTTAPWLAVAKADDTAYGIAFRSSSGGQLQNYAWANIAGMVLDSDGWNTIIVDFDASGKYNLTIENLTGTYVSNGLSMASSSAVNLVAIEVGADSAVGVIGDTMAVFNFSNTGFTYAGTFPLGVAPPPAPDPVAVPIIVCFTIKPVCVDVSDRTLYMMKNNRMVCLS